MSVNESIERLLKFGTSRPKRDNNADNESFLGDDYDNDDIDDRSGTYKPPPPSSAPHNNDDRRRRRGGARRKQNGSTGNDSSPPSKYRQLTNSEKWAFVAWIVMMLVIAGVDSVSLYFWSDGKSTNDDVFDELEVNNATIAEASKLQSTCFECVEYKVNPVGGGTTQTPGEYTTLVRSKMELTDEAARHVHFPGGIQMPGVIFGMSVNGLSKSPNPPVIFTRGTAWIGSFGGLSLQGNAGYTSLAYVIASSVTVAERCEALTTPANGVQDYVSVTPQYVLKDDSKSPPDYYYCMCTFNADSAVGSAAAGEQCTKFDTTI